jgi:transcriptional regulator with XRE-family HTH domain
MVTMARKQTPEELAFIANFQARLRETREGMGFSQELFAKRLGLTKSKYIRYENRPTSVFPIHLIPELASLTDTPIHFWFGAAAADARRGRARFALVNN